MALSFPNFHDFCSRASPKERRWTDPSIYARLATDGRFELKLTDQVSHLLLAKG